MIISSPGSCSSRTLYCGQEAAGTRLLCYWHYRLMKYETYLLVMGGDKGSQEVCPKNAPPPPGRTLAILPTSKAGPELCTAAQNSHCGSHPLAPLLLRFAMCPSVTWGSVGVWRRWVQEDQGSSLSWIFDRPTNQGQNSAIC